MINQVELIVAPDCNSRANSDRKFPEVLMSNFTEKFKSLTVAFNMNGIESTNTYTNITGAELWEKIKNPRIGDKNGSHFLRTNLKLDEQGKCLSRTNNHCAQEGWLIIIDVDETTAFPQTVHDALKSADIAHILVGTHSYYAENKNRFRILLLCDSAYNTEQLEPTSEAAVERINCLLTEGFIHYAKENKVFSQPWYTPSKLKNCDTAILYLEYLEGKCVPIKKKQLLPDINKEIPRSPISLTQGQISPITAWNEQIPVGHVLQEHGYRMTFQNERSRRWISPSSTSGQGGITENIITGKIFSHHNDSLNDGYSHDSFDVMRILENLSFNDAIKFASRRIKTPDGSSIDQWNKKIYTKHNTGLSPVISFQQYQPFNNDPLPVEALPYEALPNQMSAFIKEQSDIRGCPPDFVLISILARMGLLFSGKVKIAMTRNTSWSASPNFFWIMVGNPSSGKSNALSASSKPIQIIEEAARNIYKHDLRAYQEEMDLLLRQLSSIKKGLDRENEKNPSKQNSVDIEAFKIKIKETQGKIYDLEAQKPTLKHYTVGKTSIEKLILILSENPDGILCEFDEVSTIFTRFSKDEHSEERGLYLTGYNGNCPYSYKTINRGDVIIHNLVLGILGGVQPSKLKRFVNDARNGSLDDGFLQRFQGIVFPDVTLRLLQDKQGSDYLLTELNNLFQNLNDLPSGVPTILEFDDKGQIIFDEWREKSTIEAHDLEPHLSAHIGKSYEFVALLALYLYFFENNGQLPKNNQITVDYVHRAIQLGAYFLSHAKRMYALAYKDNMPARSLAGKMTQIKSPFNRSEIRDKGWADLNTKEERLEAINVLIKRGYLSMPIQGKYYINPECLAE